MQRIIKILPTLLLFSLLFTVIGFGQEIVLPPIIGPDSPLTDLLSWTDLLYGAIVILMGYVSQYIPGINKIPKTVYRVLAIGLIVGAMFLLMGKSNAFGLLFAFLSATNFYELLLKFIKKTPNKNKQLDRPKGILGQ